MAKIVKVTEKGKNQELTYPSTVEQVSGLSTALSSKVDKVSGKVLSTNDYTTAEKTKLAGIATGANAYTHPTTAGNKHIPSGGASGQILRWSADGTAVWGADNNTTYAVGTSTTAGITKLYGGTGTATDGTMTQSAIKTALDGKTDTHYKATPVLGTSGATANTTTTNTTTFLNIVENGTKSGGVQIKGSGATTVSATGGVLTISSTDNNTDTHYKATPVLGTSRATANTTTTNTTTYLHIVEDGQQSGSVKISGLGIATVSAENGGLDINVDRTMPLQATWSTIAKLNLDELKEAGVYIGLNFINAPLYPASTDHGLLINFKSGYPAYTLFQIYASWTGEKLWVRTIVNVDQSGENSARGWREL